MMKELTVQARIDNVAPVTEFIDAELEAVNCSQGLRIQINVAVDEIFSNIAKYAYSPSEGSVTLRIEVTEDPLMMSITFIDTGEPYNPLDREAPVTTLKARERRIGGLGIFIVKKTMDEMFYEYRDGRNMLTIRKLIH